MIKGIIILLVFSVATVIVPFYFLTMICKAGYGMAEGYVDRYFINLN